MSLWYKPVKDIVFKDVDDFLLTAQPENSRLDYKINQPGDLAKTIAAFANTMGGLIIVGVDADKVTNRPVWPPAAGMPSAAGLEETVVQVSRDAIYPPVRVGISPVIANERLPGHVLLIIRVDESPAAPHAVEKRRKVYIYERVDNTSDPHSLADIDRIQALLMRRNRVETDRQEYIDKAMNRSYQLLRKSGDIPFRWVSVIPLFPWRDLSEPSTCHELLRRTVGFRETQRIPGGAAAIEQATIPGHQGTEPIRFKSLLANGHAFVMEYMLDVLAQQALEASHRGGNPNQKWLDYVAITEFFHRSFEFAREFYKQPVRAEFPGMLLVQVGLADVRGFMMHTRHVSESGRAFLDNKYMDEDIITGEEFILAKQGTRRLYQRLEYGFDVEYPARYREELRY